MSSDDSWHEGEQLPAASIPNPYSYDYLLDRVLFYQRKEREGGGKLAESLKNLSPKTFEALTGFQSFDAACEEYEKAGGEEVFGQIHRHAASLDEDLIKQAAAHVRLQFPGCEDEVKRAEEKVSKRRVVRKEPKDRRGRKAVVEPFSVFLLVFMYVHGGVREFEAPFLPGVFCSQSHFSRLLDLAASVVFQKWGKLYYEKRGLDWLWFNASPSIDRSQYRRERKFDETLQKADVVLLLDGCAVPCEKSQGLREQKECFDWSKDERQEIRFLVLVNLNGEVVELSKAVGGRRFECEVATDMCFLERWEEEAVQKNYDGFHIHLVVDRGFYDFKRWVDGRNWTKLVITIEHPSFLNPVKHRGERYTAEEKKKQEKKV